MSRIIAAFVLLMWPVLASAQELEPGAYWPLPSGLNILTGVGGVNWGDVTFDPALPVEDASATITSTAVSFTRAFNLAGRSANVGAALPIVGGHVQGVYLGEHAETDRFGLGDPRLRIAVNLYGAPAMTPRQFASYRQDLIVGVSLVAVPPLGQYDPTKVINLGTNRWSFKPELGLSQTYRQMGRRVHGRRVVLHGQHRLLRRTNARAGSNRRRRSSILRAGSRPPCGWPPTPISTRAARRPLAESEPRSPEELADRRHLFERARRRPRDPCVGKPGRVHDDRRRLHVHCRRLQLRLAELERMSWLLSRMWTPDRCLKYLELRASREIHRPSFSGQKPGAALARHTADRRIIE